MGMISTMVPGGYDDSIELYRVRYHGCVKASLFYILQIGYGAIHVNEPRWINISPWYSVRYR